jgi:hypothetical protein
MSLIYRATWTDDTADPIAFLDGCFEAWIRP